MDGSCKIVVFVSLLLLIFSNVDLCICRAFGEVECIPSEREALLKTKSHLSDPSNRLSSWSPLSNCCNWPLVVCHNITGHVLELHLSTPPPFLLPNDVNLYETSMFGGLLDLKDVILYETSMFGGEVHPSLLDLKHLKYLDLSGNDFGYLQIPPFLGSVTSLTYLNLSHAVFGGSIPLQFWNLSNLIYLDLGGNHLEGSIPHQIGKLSNLQYLDLGDNKFSGSIPRQIGKLTNLQYLNLTGHYFAVRIPHQIGNLSNLLHLDLFSNSVPHQIGNLSNLIHLDLRYEVSIPVENIQCVSTLTTLQYLQLSYVNLSETFGWLQVLQSLPSLRELHLLSYDFNHHFQSTTLNFSSLVVLHLSSYRPESFGTSLIPNWIFQLKNLVHLQLNGNFFRGSIPDGIRNLTLLQHLDLSQNEFNSSIPDWLFSLSHLESLILSQNFFVGSISFNIGNLTSLLSLDLSGNYFEGPIPASLGNHCNLKELILSNNKCNQTISEILKILSTGCDSHALEIFRMSGSQLTSHLTDHIGILKNLVELDLSDNSIQGPIPSSFGKLISLKYLSLNNNAINSSIPTSFGNLTSLMFLDLSENQLDGNPFEILGSLSKLNDLYLQYNLFQGVVKEAHLVNFGQLQKFSAAKNMLTLKVDPNWNPNFPLLRAISLVSWNLGPHFPSWIQSLNNLEALDISDTKIGESIPTWFWGKIGNFQHLNLSNNHIEGDLSNILINITDIEAFVDLSSNKLHGQLPYVSQTVGYIDLSNNRFSGSIAHFLCHQQEEPKFLFFLNLASNNLSGTIPNCWMNWPRLQKVSLENNHFTDILPTSTASLPQLDTLNLRNNNFSRDFPIFLKDRSNLIFLDLGENQFSGMVPSWVGQRLSSLRILVLRSNRIFGPVPHQICNMSVLQILDLAHNELTGNIPKCVKNLSAMLVINSDFESHISFEDSLTRTYSINEMLFLKGRAYDYSTNLGLITSIDFSSNELSGEIPTELTRLKGLHFLNLSQNHFIGQIPQNLGNMESLESLDFSQNHLTGEIPPSMSKLSFLSMLDLSYNNLTGRIPIGTQIQSFEASSFVGNYDLCGPPLNNCSSKSSNNEDKEVFDHENGINWLFVSMGFGFIVGFWAVVGPLLFKSSWRYAYFQFIDRMWYKLQYRCNY